MSVLDLNNYGAFQDGMDVNVDLCAVKQEHVDAEEEGSIDALMRFQAGIATAAGDIVLITRCYLQSALMDLPLLSIRDLLALASCTTQLQEDNVDLNPTEVTQNPLNDKMCCLHCLMDIDREQTLNHMVVAHGYRKVTYKCHTCMTTFDLKPELIYHRQSCKTPPKKKKRYTFAQVLKDIEQMDPSEMDTVTTCPICMLQLIKGDLKQHVNEVHNTPQVESNCGVCGKLFKSKITLRDHIRLVHNVGDNEVPCEICGQVFRSKKYLSNHRRNVHPKGDKLFKCVHCGKLFKSHLCRHQHIKYVHPPTSAMVECEHCPKVFKSKINLHQHMRTTHMGVRKK